MSIIHTVVNTVSSEFFQAFMRTVIENNMHMGDLNLNFSPNGDIMKNWINEWRAHNYQVRDIGFLFDTYVGELQLNHTHGGVRCLLIAKDTSVLEGTNFITPKPEGVSLEDYHDHFHTVFGDSEAPRGTWELFPSETLATIDVASAKAILPVF